MTRPGVAAFAFGVPETIRSNRYIGDMVTWMWNEHNAPVYTQQDVPVQPGIDVTYTPETGGDPPPTLRIARGAVKWALERGINEIWIACAGPHLWRCKRDLMYAIKEAKAMISMKVCLEAQQFPEDVWYCPDSTQPRVCTRKDWRGRERILEIMPMFIYTRVAG